MINMKHFSTNLRPTLVAALMTEAEEMAFELHHDVQNMTSMDWYTLLNEIDPFQCQEQKPQEILDNEDDTLRMTAYALCAVHMHGGYIADSGIEAITYKRATESLIEEINVLIDELSTSTDYTYTIFTSMTIYSLCLAFSQRKA